MGQIAQQLLALNSAKHAIRQAINDKGGGPLSKGAPLSAYPAAIEAIPTGSDAAKTVVFYDYDGTEVISYSVEDFLALEAMPENPIHDGLTAQGWNWTLADAKTYVQKYGVLHVGQMYKPTDGKLHLSIVLSKDLNLGIRVSGTVDWGDGSAPQRVTSQGSHTYAQAGAYEVTVEGVTNIPDSMLNGCYSLQSLLIPDTVTSIGANAFKNCYSLQSVIIPSGVTSIGDSAFYDCYALKSVVIPDTVSTVSSSAFYYCYSLQVAVIPNGIRTIPSYAFIGCSLKSVVLPESVTSIANEAFYNSTLFSVVIPDRVTSISGTAFSACKFKHFTIPDGVTSVSTKQFQNCRCLESIVLPDTVTSIGSTAFSGCQSLKYVEIQDGVTSIGASAFSNCTSLKVVCKAVTPPTLGTNAFIAQNPVSIYVPDSVVADYKAATNWAAFADIIFPISALTD